MEGISPDSEVCEDGMGASGNVSALLPGVGGAPSQGPEVWSGRFLLSLSLRVQPGQNKWEELNAKEVRLEQWSLDLWVSKPSPSKLM